MITMTKSSVALERRYPNLCKVLYLPEQQPPGNSPYAPTTQMSWYLRSPMLPRIGDVIPYGRYLFSVTAVILEDCCTADSITKVDKQARRIAEKDDSPKWHAVVWVNFWGVKSV